MDWMSFIPPFLDWRWLQSTLLEVGSLCWAPSVESFSLRVKGDDFEVQHEFLRDSYLSCMAYGLPIFRSDRRHPRKKAAKHPDPEEDDAERVDDDWGEVAVDNQLDDDPDDSDCVLWMYPLQAQWGLLWVAVNAPADTDLRGLWCLGSELPEFVHYGTRWLDGLPFSSTLKYHRTLKKWLPSVHSYQAMDFQTARSWPWVVPEVATTPYTYLPAYACDPIVHHSGCFPVSSESARAGHGALGL